MLLEQLVAAGVTRDPSELLKSRDFSCLRHQHGHYSSDRSWFGCQERVPIRLESFLKFFKIDDTRFVEGRRPASLTHP